MFAAQQSDINSLKSGLLHLTGQPHCKKCRSAKVKDGVINLIVRNYLIDRYSFKHSSLAQLFVNYRCKMFYDIGPLAPFNLYFYGKISRHHNSHFHSHFSSDDKKHNENSKFCFFLQQKMIFKGCSHRQKCLGQPHHTHHNNIQHNNSQYDGIQHIIKD